MENFSDRLVGNGFENQILRLQKHAVTGFFGKILVNPWYITVTSGFLTLLPITYVVPKTYKKKIEKLQSYNFKWHLNFVQTVCIDMSMHYFCTTENHISNMLFCNFKSFFS